EIYRPQLITRGARRIRNGFVRPAATRHFRRRREADAAESDTNRCAGSKRGAGASANGMRAEGLLGQDKGNGAIHVVFTRASEVADRAEETRGSLEHTGGAVGECGRGVIR